ncbi:glycosyl hydrolase 53 family protein [Limosilactobacillus reuteri]|nr:glycosyl hydrolase 53 family protein [Limosilactobacillus reuteri]MCC4440905.1 glycosyl hydrolase 53 family protein [Limosilactobacillus reuteri]
MEFKKHFKLYKSGKQWCIAAVVTFAATLGLVAGNTTVNADTLTTGGSTPQAQVNQEKGTTNTSQPASDQGKTSNTGDVKNAVPQPNNSGKTNQSQNGQDQKENAGNDNGSTGNNDQNKGQQTTDWQKKADNQWVYNGKTEQDLKGTQYVQLPTIPDTNVQGNTNWYFVKDGIAQSGVQQWAGSYYYFDPVTYLRVDNSYVQSQWGDWYMFGNDGRIVTGLYNYNGNTYYANPVTYLREKNTYVQTEKDGRGVLLGNDGAALSGVQQWAGTYYYFDPQTHLRVDNNYVQSQWGLKYMFGKDGRIATGLYKWDKNNQWYYFNPITYLAVTNDYIQANDGNWYLFTADGTAASRVAQWAGTYYYFDPVTHLRVDNNYVQSQWGDWYLFGNDGRILSGVQQWAGTYYYFDPTTYLRVDDDYVTSQWGLKYMFGKDGRIATGLYKWDKNNQWYYFDPTTYLAVTNNYIKANDGNWYLFTADGTAASRVAQWAGTYYYFDPVTHLRVDNNYVQSQWGDWYMFGPDGRIVTGLKQWYGNYYYFDPTTYLKVTNKWVNGNYYGEDGVRYQNRLLIENNKVYYFDDQGNLLKNQSKKINGVTLTFDNNGVATNGSLFSFAKEQIASDIATLIKQQHNMHILYDWTNQDNNYQEFSLHDMAQMLAQGDIANNADVITKLLKKNSLLDGKVISSQTIDLSNQTIDITKIASSFVNSLPNIDLNNSVLGVGYDSNNNKIGIILYKSEKDGEQIDVTSPINAIVKVIYPVAGSNVTVKNPLAVNTILSNEDVKGSLTPFNANLLNGKSNTEISEDVLKTIFAGLAGNTIGLDGAKTYYADNGEAYHYEFWLEGQNSDDKLKNFLALNKNVKYGDPIKVSYTGTLTWGAPSKTSSDSNDQVPASEKTSKELQLAYQTGSETGLQYDSVKVEKIPGMTDDMIRGVDVSSYQSLLNAGVKFYDFNGQESNLFKILKDSGVNWVRLRVWNDPYNAQGQPYAGGDNNEENLIKMAKEASDNGLKLLIDFQYSDFWTDPAQQILPKAWRNLSHGEMSQEVYLYTSKILNDLQKAGASVKMVQIGNEITNGAFGLYTGRNGGGNWASLWETSDGDQVAKYIQAGSSAVRRIDPTIKVAIQLETPEINKYRGIMNVLKKNNVDYDYLGTSYYPFWSTTQGNGWYDNVDLGYGANTPVNLEAIEKMAWNEFGKRTVILESGWLNNTNDADGTHNSVGENNETTNIDRYSADPQGQVDEIEDMYNAIIAQKGLGAFYWEPAWIPVKAGWNNWQYNKLMSNIYGSGWASQYAKGYAPDSVLYYDGKEAWGGSSWDNISLFDDHGHPLQSLNVYNGMLNGYESPKNVKSSLSTQLVKIWNETDVIPNDGSKEGMPLNLSGAFNPEVTTYLSGKSTSTISDETLQKIAEDLKEGISSQKYTANNGATYHYVYWLNGNNQNEKVTQFVKENHGIKYGKPLKVSYSATIVVDSEPNEPVKTQVTSKVMAKITDVYNTVAGNKVELSNPLIPGEILTSQDISSILNSPDIKQLLTGPNGESISDNSIQQVQNVLKREGINGLKTYRSSDGNNYHYQFWLSPTQGNTNIKYGDSLTLNFTASLVWDNSGN